MSLVVLDVRPGCCSVVAELAMRGPTPPACDRPPVVLVVGSGDRFRYDFCAFHGMRMRFGGERQKPRRVWRSTRLLAGSTS